MIQAIQRILGVKQDGDFGPVSRAALTAIPNGDPRIRKIQALLQVPVDGVWSQESQNALVSILTGTILGIIHHVKASSFADPADVEAFRRCKAAGGSDQECFRVGDNGRGRWGDDCSEGTGPACALPPEDWEQFGPAARKKKVLVTANGKTVTCELRDTMPHRENIKNGAGLDLSPDAVAALGLRPPIMIPASWSWA